MKRDSGVMYRSFYEAAKNLPDTNRRAFYDLLMVYMMDGETIDCDDPIALALFQMAKPQIDANNKKYKNGKKGGRPRTSDKQEENNEDKKPNENQNKTTEKPNENQKETETEPNVNENVNVNVNVNENVNEELNTSIPTTSSGEIDPKVREFILAQSDNMSSIAYQIRKQGLDQYLEKNQKEYLLLLKDTQKEDVPIEVVEYILERIPQARFRKEQIGSIPKLRKKDGDGTPYWIKIFEKIRSEQRKKKDTSRVLVL